jgi:hypothetical protein
MSKRRPDPRVDPLSMPPASAETAEERDGQEGDAPAPVRVSAPQGAPTGPIIIEQVAISTIIAEKSRTVPPTGEAARYAKVTIADPRLDALDRRMADTDWPGIVADLGALEDAGRLPPALGLAVAVAHHEISKEGNQEAVAIGVRCMAALLGVPETSRAAGLLGRRLFRKNPVRFREPEEAPPPRTSVLVVLVALVLGGLVGWLASGGWLVVRRLLH